MEINKLVIIFFSITLLQCSEKHIVDTIKMSPNDPFKNTITPSQFFEIDMKQDNVVEGEHGTIIICPKGCFKNKKGEIVETKVKVELAEALTLDNMLLSNLTTTSNGKPLVTDGMIYLNATANNEQLVINKSNPIHIEIPTSEKKPNMKVYKGTRDENGNMNWNEPQEIDRYLKTVDINSLDFLPNGFRTRVEQAMPYKHYKTATPALVDSLYYSLIKTERDRWIYSCELGNLATHNIAVGDTLLENNCGIDPAIIKVIKSEKYQNTLIATKEFETRLKLIFETCHDTIIEIYINNLDKNLYELDEMAANCFENENKGECFNDFKNRFSSFAQQRLTKVKEADKYAALLKNYYAKQLEKVKLDLQTQQEKVKKALLEKNKEAEKLVKDYEKLLWKREKYRMETYGFNWTETGWLNIDNGEIAKNWDLQELAITVENGKEFDRVYTYIIYNSIKSLYKMNSADNQLFKAGNEIGGRMIMPKNERGFAVTIGYKNEDPFLATKEFEFGNTSNFSLKLMPASIDKVNAAIKPFEKFEAENRISQDLEFMTKFHKEEKRKQQFKKEEEFISGLWYIAFPCCDAYLMSK